MALTTRLPNVREPREHFNERTRIGYHQAPPWVRVVAHVGDAGEAKPHLDHNPLSLLGTCHAMPLRKLNDPALGLLLLFLATRDAHARQGSGDKHNRKHEIAILKGDDEGF